jgi:hypothetical protein
MRWLLTLALLAQAPWPAGGQETEAEKLFRTMEKKIKSANAVQTKADGARLRPPARPTLTMQSGKDQRFGTIFFSSDGKRLAGVTVAGHIGEAAIYVWDAATGKQLFTRSWHKKTALTVRFNDDGTLLVASAPLPSEKPGELLTGWQAPGRGFQPSVAHLGCGDGENTTG